MMQRHQRQAQHGRRCTNERWMPQDHHHHHHHQQQHRITATTSTTTPTKTTTTTTALLLSCYLILIMHPPEITTTTSSSSFSNPWRWYSYVHALTTTVPPYPIRRPHISCRRHSHYDTPFGRYHHHPSRSTTTRPPPPRGGLQLYDSMMAHLMFDPVISFFDTATTTTTDLIQQQWSTSTSTTSLLMSSSSSSNTNTLLLQLPDNFNVYFPFSEMGRELSQSLDIGSNLSRNVGNIPETATNIVLESLGYDLLVFLSASVLVTPICRTISMTPILGYLIMGAILGPHGFDVFANTKADVELGDFGILFLLFSEGLEVTRPRLRKLVNFLPLGLAQISLVTGVLSAAFVTGVPEMLGRFLPLDQTLLDIHRPAAAIVLAFAGALSTSAFIFPVLKERGWEEEESGEAATSILLLQDLLVAPLLVLLPFLVSETATDYTAFGYLTLKATLGFGAIMYGASFILQRLFALVAQTQSTETFVALCLLVAAGMGTIAKFFGLTDTAGAFAAGVVRDSESKFST